MTDKEYKYEKKRIQKLKKKWVSPLGLGWWRLTFNYYDDSKFSGKAEYSPKSIGGFWEAAFSTSCDFYYKTATIDCYTTVLKSLSDEELEEYFLHELMHISLSPLHKNSNAGFEELVATSLAQAFIWSKQDDSK